MVINKTSLAEWWYVIWNVCINLSLILVKWTETTKTKKKITDHYFDWEMMWLTSVTEMLTDHKRKVKAQGQGKDTHTATSLISPLSSSFLFLGNAQLHDPPAGVQKNKTKKLVWRGSSHQCGAVTHHQKKIAPLPTVWAQAEWGLMFFPLIKLQRKEWA